MSRTLTLHEKKRLILADLGPCPDDLEIDSALEQLDALVFEQSKMTAEHEAERKEVTGSPWHIHYENAVSALVRSEALRDNELLLFQEEVLENQLFQTIESAILWVEKIAGAKALFQPIELNDFELERQLDEELLKKLPNRSEFVVFPAMDHLIGLFVAVPLPLEIPNELRRLKETAQTLSERYGCLEENVTALILTNQGFVSPAYMVRTDRNFQTPCMTRIRMEIDPVLPPELVAEIYRNERNKLKKNWHKLTTKHVKLAEFVARRSDLKNWRDRWEQWNQRYNQWVLRPPHGWAYKPAFPTRHWTDEEKEEKRKTMKEFDEKDDRWVSSLEDPIPDYTALPNNYREMVEIGYHNFRRDASRARQRLLDPYNWKPKKREDK